MEGKRSEVHSPPSLPPQPTRAEQPHASRGFARPPRDFTAPVSATIPSRRHVDREPIVAVGGLMDFVISKDSLLRELQSMQGVVEKKSTIPILSNIVLDARKGRVELLATDLEVAIRTT